MVGEAQINDLVTLVLGTSAMLLMLVAIIAIAFLFQRKLIKKERAYRDIEKLLQKQELESAYVLIRGQDEERKRIASDVHDNLGNLLATLKIYSDLVLKKPSEAEVDRLNNEINHLIENLTTEVRKIAHSLDFSTLKNFGLTAAIEQLCEAITNSGKINVTSIIDVQRSPEDGDSLLNLYRIVQELFTNTLKHAQASQIRFEITQVNSEITIIHEDNGVGFDVEAAANKSMGLQNIQSRVNLMHGDMKIQSSPNGSAFIIEIPIPHGN
ncbi:MAG TPA: ATP-binding protein [Cyclobacteriaceae bacterium]